MRRSIDAEPLNEWLELEQRRVALAYLNGEPILGPQWRCEHLTHGLPENRKANRPNDRQRFVLRDLAKRRAERAS